jgi:hypothetical protein
MELQTGRWTRWRRWQCPACGAVNDRDRRQCRCNAGVRPAAAEPIRQPDPLDILGVGPRLQRPSCSDATGARHSIRRLLDRFDGRHLAGR